MAAYFVACIIADTNHMMPTKAWQQVVVMGVHVVLLNMFAGIAAFYYFIRADDRINMDMSDCSYIDRSVEIQSSSLKG